SPARRRRHEAGLDRGRPAAAGGDPRGPGGPVPDLRDRLRGGRRPGATGAVHPGQLDEAAPQGADLRAVARDGVPAAGAVAAPAIPDAPAPAAEPGRRLPLRGLVRTPTVTTGLIKDNSLIKMLENSLSDGLLYRFRDPRTGAADVEAMLGVLKRFWGAVE